MSVTRAALVAITYAGLASAFPSMGELAERQAGNDWQGPGSGAVRGPCPGLNTLANHGYIARNGRGISASDVQAGFLAAFNMGEDATAAGANNAVNLCSSITGKTCTTFDLDMLDTPHAVEHDASLSRLDKQMANNQNADNAAFNADIWGLTMNVFGAATHIDVSLANTARITRINQAKQQDFPGWFQENDGGSAAEHAFTLSTMNDPAAGGSGTSSRARVDWVDYWFRNERLPSALGWVKPANVISNDDINNIGGAVLQAPTTTAPPKATSTPPTSPSTASPSTTGFPTLPPYKNGTSTESSKKPSGSPSTVPSYGSGSPDKTSSAFAAATSSAGKAPPPPNAFEIIYSPDQWKGIINQVGNYVGHVESYVVTALGGQPTQVPGSGYTGTAVGPVGSAASATSGSGAVGPKPTATGAQTSQYTGAAVRNAIGVFGAGAGAMIAAFVF